MSELFQGGAGAPHPQREVQEAFVANNVADKNAVGTEVPFGLFVGGVVIAAILIAVVVIVNVH